MTFSLNNQVVLEKYIKEALQPKMQGGIATPGQRNGVKGLKVLMNTRLPDGREIPKGSTAYIREEILHTHPWAANPLTCATLSVPFLIADLAHVSFFEIPDEPKDAA